MKYRFDGSTPNIHPPATIPFNEDILEHNSNGISQHQQEYDDGGLWSLRWEISDDSGIRFYDVEQQIN